MVKKDEKNLDDIYKNDFISTKVPIFKSPNVDKPQDILNNSVSKGSLDNVWIKNWIKSANYLPKKRGFMLDAKRGIIKCGLTELNGNDIFFYDNSIGGTGELEGDKSTLYFKRTDGLNGNFIIQKRKSTSDYNGNVMEMYFTDINEGSRNYLFIGRNGNYSDIDNYLTSALTFDAKETIQIGTDKAKIRVLNHPQFEIGIATSEWLAGLEEGASRLELSAAAGDTNKPWDAATEDCGAISFNILKPGGVDRRMVIDTTNIIIDATIIPYTVDAVTYASATDIGSSTGYMNNIYASSVRLRTIDANPTTPADGDIWYYENGATKQFRGQVDGTVVSFDTTNV